MVTIYVKRIKAGLMTIDEVPPKWREAVRHELGKNNEQRGA